MKKFNQQDVEKILAVQGSKLLSEYTGYIDDIKIQCQCGREYTTSLRSFRRYKHCIKCGSLKKKVSFDLVQELFNERGYKLLSTEMISTTKQKLDFICDQGHLGKISYNHMITGRGCWECGIKKRNKTRTIPYEIFKEDVEKNSHFIILTPKEEYINGKFKIKIQCSICKMCYSRLGCDIIRKPCHHGIRKHNPPRGENHPHWIKDREEWKLRKRFKQTCINNVFVVLNAIGKIKNARSHILLGYGPDELRNHIFSHPNWPSVKDQKWEVDHIFPIKAFLDYGITDIKIVNGLDNLQPLSEIDNMHKSAKYNLKNFEQWLTIKGVNFISQLNN